MPKKKVTKKRKAKPGPKPETLEVDGNWEDAVKEALKRWKPTREEG
jgi:hypothetical protein